MPEPPATMSLVLPREVNIEGFSFKDDNGVLRPDEYRLMNLLMIRNYLMRQPIVSQKVKAIALAEPYVFVYCAPGSAILEQRNRPILISGLLVIWFVDEAINIRRYTKQLHHEAIDFGRIMISEYDLGYQSLTQLKFRVAMMPFPLPPLRLFVLPSMATLWVLYIRWMAVYGYPLSGISFINDRILFELKKLSGQDFQTALLYFPSSFLHYEVKIRYLNGPLFELNDGAGLDYYTNGWTMGEIDSPIPFRRDQTLKTLIHSDSLKYQTRYLLGPENSVDGYDDLICQGLRMSSNSDNWRLRRTQAIWTKDILCNLNNRHGRSHRYIPIWSEGGRVAGIFDLLWHRNHPNRQCDLLLGADIMDPMVEALATQQQIRREEAQKKASETDRFHGWNNMSTKEGKVKTRRKKRDQARQNHASSVTPSRFSSTLIEQHSVESRADEEVVVQ